MLDEFDSPVARSLERLIGLSDRGRRHLAGLIASPVKLRQRRKLIEENRSCDHFFIVISGWLAEYRQLRNGSRQILNFRLPGEVVGIECLIYRCALHSASALTDCIVAPVSRESFDVTQREFPRLATAFLLGSLRDGAILHEWTVNLGRRSAFSRIAHLFLELERRQRNNAPIPVPSIPFPLRQQDIADCTGLTTPYVNRVLQRMRGMGLIKIREDALEILNFDELARSAGFRPDYLQASPQTSWQSTFDSDPLQLAAAAL